MRLENRGFYELVFICASSILVGLLLFASFDAAIILAALSAFIVGIVFRPHRLRGWIPAIIITFLWITASRHMYSGYNTFRIRVFGTALFPILAWPLGLMLGYYYAIPRITNVHWTLKWVVLSIIYAMVLIMVEFVGYNVLGIQLDAGKAYPGWPVLNILHCPWWMQIAYFMNGIVFMGISSWMDRNDGERIRE